MINLAEGLTFDQARHEYRLGAHHVPACTSVIKSSGLVPHSFIALDELERKGELGRAVHKACHLDNIGKFGNCDERVKPHLEAAIKFKHNCKSFNLISSEYQTVAFVNGMPYGMQADVNARIDGDDTVIEWKIGEPKPHHGIQLAGYAAGLPHPKWNTPIARFMARKRIAVELRANGEPKVHPYNDKSDYEVFCSLLYLASWKGRYEKIYAQNV